MGAAERAFFGRRKGKRLRVGQEELLDTLLPALRLDPVRRGSTILRPAFRSCAWRSASAAASISPREARANPDVGFIGCEPFVNGMAKLLAVADAEGLKNIRLWDEDATLLLPRLPEALFARVSILYPDPWPKRRTPQAPLRLRRAPRRARPGDAAGRRAALRHRHRRLRRLGPRPLLRSPDFRWTAERADDWRRPWPDWPGTRYEAKALREGRVPTYVTAVRA